MENERYDREDLDRAVEAIRNGGIILYPTDTVWGIGCDAANVDAVEKIYRLKERSDSKAMLCLVDSKGCSKGRYGPYRTPRGNSSRLLSTR